MAQLADELERSNYPTRDLDIHAFGEADVEIEATLAVTSVDGAELDALVKRLAALPSVRQAFWSLSTTE
jgi:putative Mg2+ transporter-C (MgtC) family protein